MSLSFVSSAVQTGTAGGGYEETPIESAEVEEVNKRNQHKPLFEQLQKNQEEEDAEREEQQRQLMRGTCALDDDDVAHLETLQKQKNDREREIAARTQDELALFHAARAERQQIHLEEDVDSDEEGGKKKMEEIPAQSVSESKNKTIAGPKLVVKKRKLKGTSSVIKISKKKGKTEEISTTPNNKEDSTAGLGGLLCGYGSSDDDSDQ
jgi:hypothetical protein